MSCLWTIIFLSFIFLNPSEAEHKNEHHSAVVVGTVYCDTCFHQDFSKASHFISGASVAVECEVSGSRPGTFRQEVKTNEHGEFKVNLPFSVSKHVKKIRGCSVKLISSGEPFCAVAATATSSSLRLKSRKEGTHIYSAGFFTFKPLKQPELCNQKPVIKNSKELDSEKSLASNPNDPTFAPPIQDPLSDPPALGQVLPPLPPLPQLPNLPPLPGMPNLPPAVPRKQTTPKDSTIASELLVDKKVADFFFFPPNPFKPPSILPPNPLLPPPSILPPIPFLPPPSILPPNPLLPPPSILPPNPLLPPPSILPPNPFQPPPSILPPIFPSPPPSIFPPILPTPSPPSFNLPPLIPGLTPSPPPPSPSFPFVPLPPFPFQPTPGFPGPGVPPADVHSPSKTTSP